MVTPRAQSEPENFLVNGKEPQEKMEDFYKPNETPKNGFGQIWGTQSHSRRRKMILEKHPEIAKLLIPTKHYTTILTIVLVTLGVAVIYLVKDASWPVFLLVNYVIGGTINHTLHVLIHDWTHWAGNKNMTFCKFMAILCNIPMGAPSAITFGKFHSDHHNFLGQEGKDPDLPVMAEVQAIKSKTSKILFFVFISAVYAGRPLLCLKKQVWKSQIVNWIIIATTDVVMIYFWGWRIALYLLLGSWLSIGPHPAAAHIIAQHYQFAKGLETYNYFGFWNFFNLNLGYHTEHHDFPTCPWYNLPKVRAAAPQFYEHLPFHTSYFDVVWKFLFDDNFNMLNRTLRFKDKST